MAKAPVEAMPSALAPALPLRRLWQWIPLSGGAQFGLFVSVAVVLVALLAPAIAPHDPLLQDLTQALQPPSAAHPLGTDQVGRDILSRIIYGSRVSLAVGLVVQLISVTLGTVLGLVAGYYGGPVGDLVSGATTLTFAFPRLLFAIAMMAALGPSMLNLFLALGLVGWTEIAQVVRTETMAVREREYVEAARSMGAGDLRILFRYILPSITGPIIVLATMGIASAILAEASLSFLGLGIQPPTPSWGSMVSLGRDYLYTAPWMILAPGAAIFITILGLNLLGDGLRDLYDPRSAR